MYFYYFFSAIFCILILIWWKCILREQINNICLYNGLVPFRPQAIIWTNADIGQWRMYASPGLDEVT